jgi:CubicO group peptidase (beta-lactamase class C family)
MNSKNHWPGAVMGLACLLASSVVCEAQMRSKSDRVDEIFKDFDRHSPGCAVAVVQRGEIIYRNGFGMADLKNNVPIKSTTVFHAASLTKQFTAMSIMLLVNRGKIRLDAPVDKFITVPIATQKGMKIRQMLSHISGIRDQWILVTLAGKHLYEEEITMAEVLRLVAQMTSVDFDPGDKLLYSNTGYTLAGQIVQKVSGQSLSDFARDNIFRPLGMANSVIIAKFDQPVANRALGYTGEKPFQVFMPKLSVPGATNLYTTVEDLARWDHNFDAMTVGGAAALSEMQKPIKLNNHTDAELFTDDQGNPVKYGLGLMITKYRGHNVIEHDGRDAGYRTHLMRLPDDQFAVAILCNLELPETNLPREMARQVANIYLHDRLGPEEPRIMPPPETPSGPPGPDLARFTGQYRSEEIRMTFRVVQRDSSLVIQRPNFEDTSLIRGSPGGVDFGINSFGPPIPHGAGFGRPLTHGAVFFTHNGEKITGFTLTGDRSGLPRIHNFLFTKVP